MNTCLLGNPYVSWGRKSIRHASSYCWPCNRSVSYENILYNFRDPSSSFVTKNRYLFFLVCRKEVSDIIYVKYDALFFLSARYWLTQHILMSLSEFPFWKWIERPCDTAPIKRLYLCFVKTATCDSPLVISKSLVILEQSIQLIVCVV